MSNKQTPFITPGGLQVVVATVAVDGHTPILANSAYQPQYAVVVDDLHDIHLYRGLIAPYMQTAKPKYTRLHTFTCNPTNRLTRALRTLARLGGLHQQAIWDGIGALKILSAMQWEYRRACGYHAFAPVYIPEIYTSDYVRYVWRAI